MQSLIEVLQTKIATQHELAAATDASPATISRQLRALGEKVVRLGRRPYRYALTAPAFGAGDNIPIYAVDSHGNPVTVGRLRPLSAGGFFVEAVVGTPPLLLGSGGEGFFDDLPYFLQDLRPQGFLGRKIAQAIAERAGFSSDPRQWTTDQLGRFLLINGEDAPGNLMLGDQAFLRVPNGYPQISPGDYPRLAQEILGDALPGSSAGGEQPKFTAYTLAGHMMVKFSPQGAEPLARRWKDILLTEFHAATLLRESAPCSGPEVHLLDLEGRFFLESLRFDRHGEQGRQSMLSLQMIDAEFSGTGGDWPEALLALKNQNLISPEHHYDGLLLYHFGRLIFNTDMHLGNLSFAIDGSVFRLLPAYDMCAMGFAPVAGEIRPYSEQNLSTRLRTAATTDDLINKTRHLAQEFWSRISDDSRASTELRQATNHWKSALK